MNSEIRPRGTFTVKVIVEEDGPGYYAHCPDIGCVFIYGDTLDEVKAIAQDALYAYFEMSLVHEDPIPISRNEFSFSAWLKNCFAGKVGKRRQSYSADISLA